MVTESTLVEVKKLAATCYSNSADWVTFYREVLGLGGIVRRMFPGREDLEAFRRTTTYAEILQMLTKLRTRMGLPADEAEPTRVITVRIPASMYDAIQAEADDHRTSMNKLCISKLLQGIDDELIPSNRKRHIQTRTRAEI